MAITSSADYLAANRQRAVVTKTATRTTVAAVPFSTFDLAGSPGAGVLAGTNATAGVVPTDNDVGYPTLNSFVDGATGNLTRLAFSSNISCRLSIYDRLYLAGTFAFNAAATLASQPSFASRVPNGSFRNTELWIEWVAASTGNPIITITYTNELGVTGRTTGAVNLGTAQITGRCTQFPLQSGDNGVQRIESVTCTTATVGTFNVMVLRSLLADGLRVALANGGETYDMSKTGLLPVLDSSALYLMVTPDGTNTGLPSFTLEISSK